MKSMTNLLNETRGIKEFAKVYFRYLTELLDDVDTDGVALLLEELEAARRNRNTVFIIGNGGSAATASHMANDLSLGICKESEDLQFRAIALTDNVAAMTATANDYGYENLFVRQLIPYYKPGDKLIAISASGNSQNVVLACEWVKKKKGRVIGFVGFDGGKLKNICDVFIHVKTEKGEYGPVEDIHMIIEHLIYMWLRNKKERI